MKKHTLTIAIISLVFGSCVSPINMTQDRAKTLGKNNLEAAGSYTQYSTKGDNSTSVSNNNYGARFGYGLSDNVDLKIRYERLVSASEYGGAGNYLSIFPKVNLVKEKLSLIVPVSSYFDTFIFDEGSRYSIAPEFLGTLTFGKTADITGMVKGDYFFSSGSNNDDFYVGFKIGFGISSDLDQWAIRPEVGHMFSVNEKGQIWSYGVGVVYIFNFRTKD
jgi:hypothetical protein